MEISFTNKEESKKAQLEAFLKLTPTERVIQFYRLMEAFQKFPTKKKQNSNFLIEIHE